MKKILKSVLRHKIVTGVIAVFLFGGYFLFFSNKSAVPATQYMTAKAEKGTLVVSVTGSGQVSALNEVSVQAKVSGTVLSIPVVNNQRINAGDVLIKLDPTDDERAVRNAEASLDNAKLALQELLAPAATSTLLQAEASLVQAKQSLETNTNNLATDYNTAYTDISNTFIDLPGVMTGVNSMLYGTAINRTQADIDVYTDAIRVSYPTVTQYHDSTVSSHAAAVTAYDGTVVDFKNSSIYSSTSTIESLLGKTTATLKSVSSALGNTKNFLDFVNNVFQQNTILTAPAQLAIDRTNIQSYITAVNNHLLALLQIQNSIQADERGIETASLSIGQTSASLDQLKAGATELQIAQQELTVTQAQNALSDAKENLGNDYVRAPFKGIVTNITAKVGQPASGTLATLISDTQIAQATFNEIDVVHVQVGQQATVTFDALPDLTLTGKVSEVDALGTVSQGVVSYNVKIALDLPNPLVKSGMSDSVSIITQTKPDVLLVPNAAVSTKQGVSTVQVMESNGIPSERQVTIGSSSDTMTEIVSGLSEGDNVVTQTITSATTAAKSTNSSIGGIRIPGVR